MQYISLIPKPESLRSLVPSTRKDVATGVKGYPFHSVLGTKVDAVVTPTWKEGALLSAPHSV